MDSQHDRRLDRAGTTSLADEVPTVPPPRLYPLPHALPNRTTPVVSPATAPRECPACKGSGWVDTLTEYDDVCLTISEPCRMCDATGTVTATTRAAWLAIHPR